MQTNYQFYNFEKSLQRIDEILNSSNDNYKEVDYIPSESQLTFTNGFYVNATSLFVDVRDSTNLSQNHKKPILAKIFKITITNANKNCKYIHIDRDCISGVYDAYCHEYIAFVLNDVIKIR